MKRAAILFCLLLGVLSVGADAQNYVQYFACVQLNASCIAALRSNSVPIAAGTVVSVAGFFVPGDSAGGTFVVGPECASYATSGVTEQGTNTVSEVPSIANLQVGSSISGSGIPAGAEVASISPGTPTSTITITLAATQTSSGPEPLTVSGDNGGTLIQDRAPTPDCFYKTNYRGDPHEFGAYGDGATDDTAAIQNWLGAYGSVPALSTPATSPPTNFGPWIASVPANYKVTQPLFCPPNATLQGGNNLTAGMSGATSATGSPPVRIFVANSGFTTGAALLTTGDYCRITGLAFDANGASNTMTMQPLDTVVIGGTHNSIDGRTLLENGNHNLYCGTVQVDGLQLKDSEFVKSGSDNIYMPNHCANVRLTGDLIQSSKGNGVVFGGDDLTISGGVIEESQDNGLDLEGAHEVTACETYYDDNGTGSAIGSGYAAIRIANSGTVTVCGNHVQRSGGDPAGSAQIVFSGSNDNLTFGANIYRTNSTPNDPTVRPWYVYDADTSVATTLTNAHFYETPSPQIAAVWSPNAVALGLPALQLPQTVHNSYAGLTLSNDSAAPAQTVDIAAGAAADSTNAAVIQSPPCPVNLTNGGLGGLDDGSLAPTTTYFFFAVASTGGANPGCMASTNQTPKFKIDHFGGTPYMLDATGWTQAGSTEVYNVSAAVGVAPGIAVDSPDSPNPIASGTTVAALETSNASATGTWTGGSSTITVNTTTSGTIRQGMIILDTTGQCIPAATIVSIYASPTITLSNPTNAGCNGSYSVLQLSSGQQVSLSQPATQTGQMDLRFSTALYRLAGALYTDDDSDVVLFVQDGDAFYLARSVTDIRTGMSPLCTPSVGIAPQSCRLSVPCGRTAATCAAPGLTVIAFGRIVGGTSSADVLLSSPDQTVQFPNGFPGPPAFTTNSSATNTAFPFHLPTDGNGNVRVQANSASNTVYEVTDGWTLDLANAGQSSTGGSDEAQRGAAIPKHAKARHRYRY